MYIDAKKHNILDGLIYNNSGHTSIIDKKNYKRYLSSKKMKYISALDPIIIGGCPRSGTTLARALIGSHPDIASAEQEYNILMWIDKAEILERVLSFTTEEIKSLYSNAKDHIQLAENILSLYMKKNEKNKIALKHPYHILIIDDLFHYFPNMKFIHLIRDGRDTVSSLRTHPKRKKVNGKIIPVKTNNPFDLCIRRWIVALNLGKKWRKNKNYIEIKYEDIVNKPVVELKKIFNFLKLTMIPKKELLNFYKHQNEDKHLQNIEVGQPIYKKTTGRWKKDMTDEEKILFKEMAGEYLIEYGYEKDQSW
ncbi:MAG: sulfotransferase [Thermoplasmatales archaeon]|nr:MAG: sulfotransferase [Thermoplasmatales archaeon]